MTVTLGKGLRHAFSDFAPGTCFNDAIIVSPIKKINIVSLYSISYSYIGI